MHRRMIFHHPYPIMEGTSGSQVRLNRMIEGFKSIGYEVNIISGFVGERREAIRNVKEKFNQGCTCDFLYSECSTFPTLVAKGNLISPNLDFGFFNWCKKNSIPVGLFYRDVYWRFDLYKVSLPWFKRTIMIPFYWYDWLNYFKVIDHLFIPSLKMKDALPSKWPEDKLSALSPGCRINNLSGNSLKKIEFNDHLNLIYVGGVVPPLYDLRLLFHALRELNGISLTICCRESEWNKVKSYYAPFDDNKINIVHVYGDELVTYYKNADLFVLIRQNNPYLNFAMPVKVFEALGHCVPIITTSGTETARFIRQEDIGWVVHTKGELTSLLTHLRINQKEIQRKRDHMAIVRMHHTWNDRCKQVAETLIGNSKQ